MTHLLEMPARDQVQQVMLKLMNKDGMLDPHDVVNAARSPDSPLHQHFTWDDSEAAEKHRLHEARQLIRVTIETLPVDGKDVETRTFVSLSSDRKAGGYRLTTTVLSDDELRARLLEDALRELRSFEAKYRALKELSKVITPIRKILSQHDEKQMSRSA